MSGNRDTSVRPPFPPLTWREPNWEGEIVLPEWQEYDEGERKEFPWKDRTLKCDLLVSRDDCEDQEMDACQVNAWQFLLSNGEAIRKAVLEALLPYYEKLRPRWAEFYDEEVMSDIMPVISGPDDFRPLILLTSITLNPWERDGMAYVGFCFRCKWDIEHGLGFLVHGITVAKTGGAEVSFLPADH